MFCVLSTDGGKFCDSEQAVPTQQKMQRKQFRAVAFLSGDSADRAFAQNIELFFLRPCNFETTCPQELATNRFGASPPK
jgi:hypothetical protein